LAGLLEPDALDVAPVGVEPLEGAALDGVPLVDAGLP